jgi:hypothetical protein
MPTILAVPNVSEVMVVGAGVVAAVVTSPRRRRPASGSNSIGNIGICGHGDGTHRQPIWRRSGGNGSGRANVCTSPAWNIVPTDVVGIRHEAHSRSQDLRLIGR